MDSRRYIKVIIPVKFRGTVTYALPEGVVAGPGEWVSVRFGAKTYTGVIAETVDEADIPDSRIREISSVERLPPVSLREIRLWKQVAEYYMCTIGEVFKCAYPERKVAREGKRLSDKEAAERRILKLARETEEKLDREFSRIGDSEKRADRRFAQGRLLPHEPDFKKIHRKRHVPPDTGHGRETPGQGLHTGTRPENRRKNNFRKKAMG